MFGCRGFFCHLNIQDSSDWCLTSLPILSASVNIQTGAGAKSQGGRREVGISFVSSAVSHEKGDPFSPSFKAIHSAKDVKESVQILADRQTWVGLHEQQKWAVTKPTLCCWALSCYCLHGNYIQGPWIGWHPWPSHKQLLLCSPCSCLTATKLLTSDGCWADRHARLSGQITVFPSSLWNINNVIETWCLW